MPRLACTVVVGCPHHITQRGNNRQDVFFVDDDRHVYLELLKQQAARYALEVVAYCLMTNHIHLVAIPHAEDSLARAVGRTHFRYTQYVNRMHQRSGHLWQGRFHSCAMDQRRLWPAIRYAELNPVRAKLCRKPWRYAFSSAAAHMGESDGAPLLNLPKWFKKMSAERWRKELSERLDDRLLDSIRLNTHTGRPLGTDSFLSKLETKLSRRVRPLPVGRPKKKTKNTG